MNPVSGYDSSRREGRVKGAHVHVFWPGFSYAHGKLFAPYTPHWFRTAFQGVG